MSSSQSDRLDRLETLAETTLLAVQQLGRNQAKLEAQQDRLQNQQDRLQAQQDRLQSQQDRLQAQQEKFQIRQEKFQSQQEKFQAQQDRFQAQQDRIEAQQEKLQNQLAEEIAEVVGMISTLATQMGETHTEIRGLQIENRRILAYLFNEAEGEDEAGN
jgi:peptidoglycan hydrolase CwlO-like protein